MALFPEQIVTLDAIVATGKGNTVIVTEPETVWLQLGVPAEATLTSVITVFAAYVLVSVAVPEPFSNMVWFEPLLTV